MPTADARISRHHFVAGQGDVFTATLETVRSMPGWEVLTAHPETGEIRARSRGRLFSPTMDHTLRLVPGSGGTEVEIESASARQSGRVDDRSLDMFRVLLEDRLARGYFGVK